MLLILASLRFCCLTHLESFNPLPHNTLSCQFLALPTQQQIKNMITSNFFFTHNVFKSCLLLMHQNEYLWSSVKLLLPFIG